MKTILFFFITTTILMACSNSSNSEKELELRERELELRERELSIENKSDNYSSNQSESNQNSSYSSPSRQSVRTESELRQDLSTKEARNPKNYLSVDYNLTYKVLSGQEKISGTIFNSATLATFKDVELIVSYSTETNTSLGSENFIIYDYIYPGNSVPFTIKTYSPQGTKKIGVKVKTAKSE
ncbi:MAG: hypothetical protein ACKOXP_07180 [Flavobacteriales bacterium]